MCIPEISALFTLTQVIKQNLLFFIKIVNNRKAETVFIWYYVYYCCAELKIDRLIFSDIILNL